MNKVFRKFYSMTTLIAPITLDQLADLVLAILDCYTSTKPCRTMSEPLLSAMYRAYTALKCDDETQCETIYNELCAVME